MKYVCPKSKLAIFVQDNLCQKRKDKLEVKKKDENCVKTIENYIALEKNDGTKIVRISIQVPTKNDK